MEITIEDVRQLTFELYLAQRENGFLRGANAELTRLLLEVNDADPSGSTSHAHDHQAEHGNGGKA